jgi:secernin
MCDTLCVLTPEGTIFAKSSDRPAGELQLPEVQGPRPAGGRLRTQYLAIEDEGSCAVLLSRPDWLWGAEHGINEHGVAIGNEKVDTTSGVGSAPPALIGMDLVRLGLERARSGDAALDVMVGLLERHGQGGVGDRTFQVAYDSSFMIADGAMAWVLETAGRTWAAKRLGVGEAAAISNRLSIRQDWTCASRDVPGGVDFDAWRDTAVDTAYTDGRLAASRAFLGRPSSSAEPERSPSVRQVVAHLRDHGSGPWGEPGRARRPEGEVVAPPPSEVGADGSGITVCMHVGGVMATTASTIALLPPAGGAPLRSWVAVGSPCVSVYVPLLGLPERSSAGVDSVLWHQGSELRRRVEEDGGALGPIRDVLDPLEAELWEEADELVDRPGLWAGFHEAAWQRVAAAASDLARSPSRGRV